jgi:hypothetical protein
MIADAPEHTRSPRPVRGTAGLRGFIMQANTVCAAGYGKRRDGAKRAMPSTSTTTGASHSVRLPNPERRPGSKDRPSVLLHLMESQSNIQLSGSGSKGSEGKGVMGKVAWYHEEWQPVDAARYGDSVHKESLRVLSAERAQMSCMHCKRSLSFNPSTRFRNHLLFDCDHRYLSVWACPAGSSRT